MTRRSSPVCNPQATLQIILPSPPSRYVCLQCRYRATYQPSTPTRQLLRPIKTSSLRRTYATESSIGDRVGWHKKFTDAMNKRMWKEGQAPTSDDQDPQKPGTEVQGQPQRPNQEPTAMVDDTDYAPAVSGEGLEMIGGPSGWWEEGWDEEHHFQGYMPPTPVRDPAKIRAAIERALVEAITLYNGPRRLRRLMMKNRARSVEGPAIGDFNLSQTEDGKLSLQWRRQEDETSLREYLGAPKSENQELQELEPAVEENREDDELEAEIDRMLSDPDYRTSETTSVDSAADMEDAPLVEASGEESLPTQAEEAAKEQYTGLQKSITLTDPELKFSVIKRVMQLTGKRIPDPAIQAIESSRDLYYALIQKPKPTKLADILQRGIKKTPQLKTLPNVRVVPYKQHSYMKESALGRKKIIERRLDEIGIQEPFRDAMEAIEASEKDRLLNNQEALAEFDPMEEAMEQDAQEQNAMEQPQVNEQRSVSNR